MPMREIVIGYLMLLALGFAGTFVIRRECHKLRGLVELRWAFAAMLLALVAMFLRGFVPLVIVSAGGQTAILLGFVFLHLSLARAIQAPHRLFPFLALLLPSFVGALCYFSLVHNSLDGRMIVASIGVAIMLAWTARLAMRPVQPALQMPLRWMFRLLVVMSALRIVRFIVTLNVDPNPNLRVLDPVQSLLVYLLVLGGLAQAAGTFWISICAQQENDRVRADTDGLTGLLNRRAFEEILLKDLAALGTESVELSLLLIDLDFFKSMNDEFGHLAGDTVLRRVSSVLRHAVRPVDSLARFGGDEFAILLRSAEPGQGLIVAERVLRGLVHMRNLPGNRKMTASLGIATALERDTPVLLIERADRALYRSKNLGRNRLTHFEDDDPPGTDDSVASVLIQ